MARNILCRRQHFSWLWTWQSPSLLKLHHQRKKFARGYVYLQPEFGCSVRSLRIKTQNNARLRNGRNSLQTLDPLEGEEGGHTWTRRRRNHIQASVDDSRTQRSVEVATNLSSLALPFSLSSFLMCQLSPQPDHFWRRSKLTYMSIWLNLREQMAVTLMTWSMSHCRRWCEHETQSGK